MSVPIIFLYSASIALVFILLHKRYQRCMFTLYCKTLWFLVVNLKGLKNPISIHHVLFIVSYIHWESAHDTWVILASPPRFLASLNTILSSLKQFSKSSKYFQILNHLVFYCSCSRASVCLGIEEQYWNKEYFWERKATSDIQKWCHKAITLQTRVFP